VGGGVGIGVGGQESGDVGDVFAGGDQGGLLVAGAARLPEADGGEQAVAKAFATDGVLHGSALAHVVFDRFGGATVAERAVFALVGAAQVPDVADARAFGVGGAAGDGVGQLHDLEGEAGRRGQRVGVHAGEAGAAERADLSFDLGGEAGFVAKREGGADLHADGAGCLRGAQLFGAGGAAGQPEGQAELAELGGFGFVARTIDGFAGRVEGGGAARGGVVSAGGGGLDHEAVHLAGGFARERGGGRGRGDDGEEAGTLERGGLGQEVARIEFHPDGFVGVGVFDVEPEAGGLAGREFVERAGDGPGDARAHEHV